MEEIGMCKADMLDRTRRKQFICKVDAGGLLRLCSLEEQYSVPGIPGKVLQKCFVVVVVWNSGSCAVKTSAVELRRSHTSQLFSFLLSVFIDVDLYCVYHVLEASLLLPR